MSFNGFKKEGIEFLKELKNNNSKEWFETNRHIWQKYILEPNIEYIEEMGETLLILSPSINAKPKVSGSLFKIYRDIRFSKDKTPMKSKIGLLFWKGSSHRMQSSSFYMHYDKDSYFIATGIRGFKPPLLKAYREYIKNELNAKALDEILTELKSKGIDIVEPHYKKYPKGFDKESKYAYLSLYNSMYAYENHPLDETFFSLAIVDKNFEFYQTTQKLFDWIYELTLFAKNTKQK